MQGNPVQPNCMHPPHQRNVVIQASKAGCVGARQLIARRYLQLHAIFQPVVQLQVWGDRNAAHSGQKGSWASMVWVCQKLLFRSGRAIRLLRTPSAGLAAVQ